MSKILLKKIKEGIRAHFYSSTIFRRLLGKMSIAFGRSQSLRLTHLDFYKEHDEIGSIQQSEALLLHALIKTTNPKTLLEFGFYRGLSAFNFLQAMAEDAILFSYDIDPQAAHIAQKLTNADERFRFLQKSQIEFQAPDIDNAVIDFVFFDASHELEMNKTCFQKIKHSLAPDAILAIHDTGLWNSKLLAPKHKQFFEQKLARKSGELGENNKKLEDTGQNGIAHQIDERRFVNWILAEETDFHVVHFHATRSLRHGLSLLQKVGKLAINF